MDQEQLKAAALRLAAMGARVFPLQPGGKLPAVKAWPKWATSDPERIAAIWSKGAFNVGVAMGEGWVGLDIDMKNGANGLASLAELGVELQGFVVATPSGGRHVYYHGPDVGNSAGRLGAGLDVRGVHGYLVGPGSVVEAGAYTLVSDDPPLDVPAAIIHRCLAPRERGADLSPAVEADRADALQRASDYLRGSAPLAVEGQAGDHTTYQVAARLKDFGVSAEAALALMGAHWNPRCAPPWDADDLAAKVRNAYEYGVSPLGIAHPSADFENVKVTPPTTETVGGRSWFRHGGQIDLNVNWLFHQILPAEGVGVLVAPTGAGKTFLAIELARCGATGKPFFGAAPDENFATLFVFGGSEGSGFPLRLAALGEDAALPISGCQCGNLAEAGALAQLCADLKAEAAWMLAEHGVRVGLIVLETLAASGLILDENDNGQAGQAMRNLATLGRELGAFVLTSHHPAKDGKGMRGASAIPSAIDYSLEIEAHGQTREVELTKARNAEARRLGSFTLLPVTLGVDSRGREVTSRTISTGEPMTKTQRKHAHTDKVLRALELVAMDGDAVELRAGVQGVPDKLAREVFRDNASGSYRDASNAKKAFDGGLAWLSEMGRVESLVVDRETFHVVKPKIGEDHG